MGGSGNSGVVVSLWQNLMWNPLIGTSQFTKMTSSYLARGGVVSSTFYVLHSAPFIFNSVADMVEWILLHKHRLSDLLHYLDDFITAGPPQSSQCAYNLNTAVSVCVVWVQPLL